MATREIETEMDKESVARTRKREPPKLSRPVPPFYPGTEIQVHSSGLLFLKRSLRWYIRKGDEGREEGKGREGKRERDMRIR